MGWISFCLFALLISSCHLKPVEDEEVSAKEAMPEAKETPEVAPVVTDVVDENEIKRYNDYMDAVYRRMNAALRAKLMDPMELNLDAKDARKAKKKDKKDSAKRVTREADEEIVEVDEEEDEDEVDRMGELDDEEAQDAEVDRMGEVEVEKKKNKRKNKNKKKDRDGDDEGEMEETKRKKKAKKNKKSKDKKEKKSSKKEKKEKRAEKRARKAARKQEREAAKNSEEGEELSRERRNKQSKGRGSSRKQKKRDSDEGKAKGSLSGIATLRRSGAVEITVEEDHKIISSEFTVGPLQLEVSKSFGEAKERQVKTAKASTDVMKGVMVLKVKADGSAHVKKVVFKKPDHVDVSGSLSAKERKSETQLRNSFNRSRGLAAQKILKTARYVLKNTE